MVCKYIDGVYTVFWSWHRLQGLLIEVSALLSFLTFELSDVNGFRRDGN